MPVFSCWPAHPAGLQLQRARVWRQGRGRRGRGTAAPRHQPQHSSSWSSRLGMPPLTGNLRPAAQREGGAAEQVKHTLAMQQLSRPEVLGCAMDWLPSGPAPQHALCPRRAPWQPACRGQRTWAAACQLPAPMHVQRPALLQHPTPRPPALTSPPRAPVSGHTSDPSSRCTSSSAWWSCSWVGGSCSNGHLVSGV